MDPVDDALYRVHVFQATRRRLPPRDYLGFLRYVTGRSETDLSHLFLPEAEPWYQPVVQLGTLSATPAAVAHVPWYEMLDAVVVHAAGHWGPVSPQQWLANDRAVAQGGRICSAHGSLRGRRFWVITEADRSRTSIVMPEEAWFPGGLP